MKNINKSPTINWPKRKSHSSSNANKHPYLFERVEHPVTDKDFFINSCNDTFDKIAMILDDFRSILNPNNEQASMIQI